MKKFRLKVWGDFACFTRPEMKTERVSYDVITPSSARAIFEAILWKPALQWQIEKIEVVNPICWINLRRNEVKDKASRGKSNFYIEEERVQRAGLFLKNVAYVIDGSFQVKSEALKENPIKKYEEMFERRASQGQCFMQPYLGCREFSAYFQLISDKDDKVHPISETRDLGWMLYDMEYNKEEIKPKFFKAEMKNGIILIPSKNSLEVKG